MYTMFEMTLKIKNMHNSGMTWGEIASEMYPQQNRENMRLVLWRIINDDYYPMNNLLRERLELSPIKKVEACSNCGEVHISQCPKLEKADVPTLLYNTVTLVIVGGGEIPTGAQVIQADQCQCGQWFISNHPRRKKCFVCSEFKGRKAAK